MVLSERKGQRLKEIGILSRIERGATQRSKAKREREIERDGERVTERSGSQCVECV